jgi:CRP/FNR family cyclic AMP-dependent transcriptional regulator
MGATRSPGADAPRRYADGATITRQGDHVVRPGLIERGLVRLSAVSADGREIVLGLLGPGDVLDECALLDEPSTVSASVVHEATIRRIGGGTSADADAVQLASALARRLRTTTELLEEAMLHDVRTRLLRRLQDLATGRHAGIRLPLTQDELGRMIGASRETVNRALRELAGRGALLAGGGGGGRGGGGRPARRRPNG